LRRGGDATRDEGETGQHDTPRAEAQHQAAGERSRQAIQQHVDGDRERGPIPAELDFQRVDEDGGHRGDAGRHEHGQTGDGENHPAIVQTRWSGEVKHSGNSFPAMKSEIALAGAVCLYMMSIILWRRQKIKAMGGDVTPDVAPAREAGRAMDVAARRNAGCGPSPARWRVGASAMRAVQRTP
jgi:hypothetical protein